MSQMNQMNLTSFTLSTLLALFLVLPSLSLAQKVDYSSCHMYQDPTIRPFTITQYPRPRCGKRWQCYKRRARPEKVENLAWFDFRRGVFGVTRDTIGWAKSVYVGPSEGLEEASLYLQGVEPSEVGQDETVQESLTLYWEYVNEITCEGITWCNAKTSNPFELDQCLTDIKLLPARRKTLRRHHLSFGESLTAGFKKPNRR